MFLSDTSVKRPVLASMMSLAIVLFGAIAYTRLSVREYPDIDPPIISVSVFLPGANPRVMESAVTDILEEELATVEGLRTLTSVSAEQSTNITLEFNLNRSVESAAQDVRDKVSRVRGRLPREVLEPVIAKQDADAQPFYWLALSGENYSLLELSDIGDRVVKQRLQSIPGVGNSAIFGERRYSMRIWLSAKELAARGLTVEDVENAIRSRNVEIPAGRIESSNREFSVRSLGELKTPAGIRRPRRGQPGRPAGPAQGPLARRARPPRRAQHAALQRDLRRGGGHRAAVEGQHGGRGRLHPGGASRDRGGPSPGRDPADRLRPVGLRQALHQRDHRHPLPGLRAGGDRHLPLPQEHARHPGADPGHPGVHRGRLRGDVHPGVLGQHLYTARAHPGHRPRGGRRHHRAGKRLPAPGGTRGEPRGRRHARHQRNRFRGHCHHHFAGRRLRPPRLPAGDHGAALQRIRRGAGGLGGHLRLRGADADPDALRQDPPGAEEPRPGLQGARERLSTGWPPPTRPPSAGRSGTAGSSWPARAAPWSWRSSPSRRSRASSSPPRIAASSWPPPRRRRAPPCSTPTPTRSRSRRSSVPSPRSTRISASWASAAT